MGRPEEQKSAGEVGLLEAGHKCLHVWVCAWVLACMSACVTEIDLNGIRVLV